MPRPVILFCAWTLLAPAALSQQAPPDPAAVIDSLEKQTAPRADAWLNNTDPRMHAWGAYLALRDRRTEAIPALLAMVAAFPVDGQAATQLDMDRHDAMLAVLDALIQLGLETPAAEAQRMYAELPDRGFRMRMWRRSGLARQHYLASLLSDSAGQPPVSAHISHTIVWQGPDDYHSQLTVFIGEQQRAFSEVARLLGEQGLLSEEEAKSLRPKLQIRLWDQRESQEPALPAIGTLAGNVTIEPF